MFGNIFPSQRPRNVFEGVANAAKSLLMGTVLGTASFVTLPIVTIQKQGWVRGVFLGGLAGTIFGSIMAVIGAGNGVYHFCVGTIKTPSYLNAVRQGKYWDETTESWLFYHLDKEQEELASSGHTRNSNVADMELYDLLDVSSDATSKEIKRAYFGKAKILHPDKNPNDPEAGEKFRALHGAYQTLSDSDKRATYDKYGMSEDDTSSNNNALSMDAHVFFAVLFGSQAVEPYIGELSVASWTDQILKLAQAGFTPDTMKQMFDDGEEADQKRRKRQLDITLHLISRIEAYTNGTQSKEVFRAGCRAEAAMIVETTPFGDVFLRYIGAALKVQGGRYLGFHKSILAWKAPFYMINQKVRDMSASMMSVRKTIQVGWTAYTTFADEVDDDDESTTATPNKNTTQKEPKTNEEVIEILLPSILDMAWAYNVQDIGTTLQGACWRLLADSNDAITKKDRIKRAQAIQMLGDEFVSMGKSSIKQKEKEQTCNDEKGATTCKNSHDNRDMDLMSRLEVAYGVAHLKASGQSIPDDSEALIQKRTSEALAKKQSDEALARRKAKRKADRLKKQAMNK